MLNTAATGQRLFIMKLNICEIPIWRYHINESLVLVAEIVWWWINIHFLKAQQLDEVVDQQGMWCMFCFLSDCVSF